MMIDNPLHPGLCAVIRPHARLFSVGLHLLTGYGPYGELRQADGLRALSWRKGLWICGGGDDAGLTAAEAADWLTHQLVAISTELDPYQGHATLEAGPHLKPWMGWAWANCHDWPRRDVTGWPDLYFRTFIAPGSAKA